MAKRHIERFVRPGFAAPLPGKKRPFAQPRPLGTGGTLGRFRKAFRNGDRPYGIALQGRERGLLQALEPVHGILGHFSSG